MFFPSSSQVELITSHRFITPVVLQSSRLLGLMRGGVKGLEVEQLSVDGNIQVNETIVTSGLAGDIPAGLPVGYVKQVTSQPSDIFQAVSIAIPITINQVELVLVLIETMRNSIYIYWHCQCTYRIRSISHGTVSG